MSRAVSSAALRERLLANIEFALKLPVATGTANATTTPDGIWYKPCDHAQEQEKHARAYLSWEVALVEQIKRDPTIRFRAYD